MEKQGNDYVLFSWNVEAFFIFRNRGTSHAGKAISIPVVATSAMIIARIIGPLKKDVRNATATPASPAYHIAPKSVRARGKIRAPRAATGRSIMHFLMNLGSFESLEEAKYGIMRGSIVTSAHEIIRRSLFNSDLLICIYQSTE